MIPELTAISELEKLAASEEPSVQGAWWIMLQTAQSVFNSAVQMVRDPINNKVLDQFWEDLGAKSSVMELLEIEGDRPLPYDDLMQLISFCGDQLETIVSDPRHKIVKQDKMVMPYALKNTSQKTMNWLGKQPGRTIREKVAGKNRILTQINTYGYEVKENQVALSLYNNLYKKIKPRIEYRAGYASSFESPNLRMMSRIRKNLRNSNLADVKPVHHTSPNNVLLSDKNYSVIWRAYLDACKFDKELSVHWENAEVSFVKAVFLCIISTLLNFNEFIVLDKRINLKQEEIAEITFIVGIQWNDPMIVRIVTDERELDIDIFDYNCAKGVEEKRDNLLLAFSQGTESDVLSRRGYPLLVSNGAGNDVTLIHADNGGIRQLLEMIVSKLEENYGQNFSIKEVSQQRLSGTVVYDILDDGRACVLNTEDNPIDYSFSSIVYHDEVYGDRAFQQSKYSRYQNADHSIWVHTAISEAADTTALNISLKSIRENVSMGAEDYLIYVIPDSLEELNQKKLKQTVGTWFPREKTFPVWRSVAALTNLVFNTDYDIRKDDYVLTIDLMDESVTAGLISLSEEKRINGLICNHYPPFPQLDKGDLITERYFLNDYFRKYFDLRGMNVGDKVLSEIVESGVAGELIQTGGSRNYIVADPEYQIIILERDDDLLADCISSYMNHMQEYLRELGASIPNKRIYQVNILTNTFNNLFTDEEYDIFQSMFDKIIFKNEQGAISISVSQDIKNGAMIYRERLRRQLPTWTEYLPELSLQVIKDGRYAQLELIGSDVSFDVMGENNEHVVEESLVLKAGEKEFRFPLIKKDIGKKSSLIDAYIADKSFPLDHDIVVVLNVKYKYGYDNSYELTLRPVDENEKSFKEIIVEWTSERNIQELQNIWPPEITPQQIQVVLKAIEISKSSLETTADRIGRQFCFYDGRRDLRQAINSIDGFINRNVFKIRNIVISNSEQGKEFIDWLIKSDMYAYLGEIGGIFKRVRIPNSFYDVNEGKELNYLRGDCLQVMFSLGIYTPKELQDYYIANYHVVDSLYRTKVMIDMLLNNHNKLAIEAIMKDVRGAKNQDEYSVKMDGLVRELGRMCCFDAEMIIAFYECSPEFVEELLEFTVKGLGKLLNRCRKYEHFVPNKNEKKRYLAYIEILYAALRLRNPEKGKGFGRFKVGSPESRKISQIIIQLDEYMGSPKSGIRFKLDKPSALGKMSDLAYALDLYLNGDERAAYIEVLGAEDVD